MVCECIRKCPWSFSVFIGMHAQDCWLWWVHLQAAMECPTDLQASCFCPSILPHPHQLGFPSSLPHHREIQGENQETAGKEEVASLHLILIVPHTASSLLPSRPSRVPPYIVATQQLPTPCTHTCTHSLHHCTHTLLRGPLLKPITV